MITFATMKEQDSNSPIIHLQQQQLLLRMEYEYEKEEFKRQTENMGVARKVKRGLCWYPATPGRSYYNSLNQLVIEITHTENTDIEHNFEFGRPVCFFRQSADGKITYMNFTATVSYADETRMVAIMPGAGAVMEVQETDNLGVQLYFDETSYRTMFEALEDTLRSKGNRLAELRDILLGTSKAGFRELYPVRFPWLNSTQETAVNKVLCARDVASRNRKNDHLSGSHLRNPASGTAGTGMCPKQYCRRLDFGKTGRPWRQCPAYRQSDPCQRQDAFLYLRASFREPSALSGAVEHPEKSP